jgi:hypothetical protein
MMIMFTKQLSMEFGQLLQKIDNDFNKCGKEIK